MNKFLLKINAEIEIVSEAEDFLENIVIVSNSPDVVIHNIKDNKKIIINKSETNKRVTNLYGFK